MILAERSFNDNDQMQFAISSGDYNPMHMDAVVARRTQAGAQVVHGIHLLLWALDSFAAIQTNSLPLKKLRVLFNKFVFLGETVRVELIRQSEDNARLSISIDGAAHSKISLNFGSEFEESHEVLSAPTYMLAEQSAPLNMTFDEMKNLSGRLPFCMTAEKATELFPAATQWLGAQRIAAIAATTHLVGMICPGLHSIYSELSIQIHSQFTASKFLTFRIAEADERFRSVNLLLESDGLTGIAKSFVRTPPVAQSTMTSLAGVVEPTAFSGSVALIVGGSRGLGELTAKLLATGGASVIITWKSGKTDAERVAQEICAVGGDCELLSYDASSSASEQLSKLTKIPTHVYYFATPSIFRPQASVFSKERLATFWDIYVNGFWELVKVLHTHNRKISMFYPSSVSITERPMGMTEYSMAKAAGEVLCEDVNASMFPLCVKVSRLPRLLTDQTASIAEAETARPIDIMLPIIKEVQSLK